MGLTVVVLVPAGDVVVRSELRALLPMDVDLQIFDVEYHGELTTASLERMEQDLLQHWCEMPLFDPDGAGEFLVVWACSSGSFYRGPHYDQELRDKVFDRLHDRRIRVRAVLTAAHCLVTSIMDHSTTPDVFVISPYGKDLADLFDLYLRDFNIDVMDHVRLQDGTLDDAKLSAAAHDLPGALKQSFRSEPDLIVLPCTGLHTLPAMAERLLKPHRRQPALLSSNMALARKILLHQAVARS